MTDIAKKLTRKTGIEIDGREVIVGFDLVDGEPVLWWKLAGLRSRKVCSLRDIAVRHFKDRDHQCNVRTV